MKLVIRVDEAACSVLTSHWRGFLFLFAGFLPRILVLMRRTTGRRYFGLLVDTRLSRRRFLLESSRPVLASLTSSEEEAVIREDCPEWSSAMTRYHRAHELRLARAARPATQPRRCRGSHLPDSCPMGGRVLS